MKVLSTKVVIPLLTFGLCMLSSLSSFAQDSGEPITIGKKINIHSKVLNEKRPLLIGLPDNYDVNDESYPVLYLLDGNGHFHHTTGIVKFLADNGRLPQMIVVGMPNTGDRTHDLTPPIIVSKTNNFPTAGGADQLLRFMSEELMPYIEKTYQM